MSTEMDRGRVLVVDDDASMRASVEGLLSLEHEVATASSLAEAVAALERRPVDVVLTDYSMPGGSGVELLGLIRKQHPNTMALLLTGHPDVAEVQAAEDGQTLVRVLTKPYDPKRLLRWVSSTVKLARLRQATNALRDSRGGPPRI